MLLISLMTWHLSCSNKPGSVSTSAHCNSIGTKPGNLHKGRIGNQKKNKERLKGTSGMIQTAENIASSIIITDFFPVVPVLFLFWAGEKQNHIIM